VTRAYLLAITALLALPGLAFAQEHAHPGEKLGTVHFETSCKPAVAPQFDRAVALLHSFEFGESIRGFQSVIAADSTCAMAWWGVALSRWSNPMAPGNRAVGPLQLGRQAAEAGLRVSAGATERERGYLRAVSKLYEDFENRNQATRIAAYESAMKELAAQNPTDTEAAIFHAIALVGTASPTDKTYAKQLEAGRLLEALWAKAPNHPGLAHYIIHSYDYPPLADKARAAAQRYASIAPSAAHALHMPSHTFTRVGMWEQSIESNTRSRNTAVGTSSIAEALHASDYAMYAYLQLGKLTEAKAILDGLPALEARFDVNAVTGAAPGSAGVFALAAIPARWALERRAWTEAAALQPKQSSFPYTEAMTYFARALGAAHTGDLARVRAARDTLAAIQKRLVAQNEPYWAEQVAIQHLETDAWLDFAEKNFDSALTKMRAAADREDATEKAAVTPGPLAPARELLGDMLMEMKKPEEARAAYRATLQREPNRRHALVGLGEKPR
jgi:tetratricopeptide (TPR) repeat protein